MRAVVCCPAGTSTVPDATVSVPLFAVMEWMPEEMSP